MCRLLGVVTPTAQPVTTSLGPDLDAFMTLSAVHCDGWGIAWWGPHDDLELRRHPGAATGEPGLREACEKAEADAALLHLRKASAGLPLTPDNTHPFEAGSVAFAHNGYFSPVDALDPVLDELGARVPVGDTDSERYFALVNALTRLHGPVEALRRAAAIISERASVVSLNALMLTHAAMYATCFFDADNVRADRDTDPDSYLLNFLATPERVLVASNGWDQQAPGDWTPLAPGAILEIRRHDLSVSVHHARGTTIPTGAA